MRTVLTYHAVDPTGSRLSVDPDAFRRQLDWLLRRGIALRTVSELLASDRPGVALAFDDGFESVVTTAMPLLAERDVVATLFPIIGALDRRILWCDAGGALPRFRLMSRDAVVELACRGWEVGSHTLDHRCLVDLTDAELNETLADSRGALRDLTRQDVPLFAYPNGCHTERTRRAVAEAGYAWALSTAVGQVRDADRFRVRRVNIGRSTSPARFAAAFVPPVQAARRVLAGLASDASGHTHPVTSRTATYE